MHQLQPQSISIEGDDSYRVKFSTLQGNVEDFTFTTDWVEDGIGVLNCDQNEFFVRTYDDPGSHLLMKAIKEFGAARRALSVASSPKTLRSMAVINSTEDPNNSAELYTVRFLTADGEEHCELTPGSSVKLTKITTDETTIEALNEALSSFQAARDSHLRKVGES